MRPNPRKQHKCPMGGEPTQQFRRWITQTDDSQKRNRKSFLSWTFKVFEGNEVLQRNSCTVAQSHRQLTNYKVCCLLQHFDRLTLWRLNSKQNIWAKSFKATREKTENHEACKTRQIQSECNDFFSKKTLTTFSPSYFEIIGGA
jgi:hypothetical protein